MTPSEQFRLYLAQEGLKVTSERLAIVDAILATPGHFEADALLATLERSDTRVSRATLYRTMTHLFLKPYCSQPPFLQSAFVCGSVGPKSWNIWSPTVVQKLKVGPLN